MLPAVAALLAVSLPTTSAIGPKLHLRQNTGHYYVFIETPMKWNDADKFAKKFSFKVRDSVVLDKWHLATITSADENNYVFGVVLEEGRVTGDAVFLGAIVKDGSLHNFNWVTGEPFRYKNWAPGQPDFERENVLEMGGIFGAQWNNEDGPGSPSEASHPFILEHEPIKITQLR